MNQARCQGFGPQADSRRRADGVGPFASMACFEFIARTGAPGAVRVFLLLRRAVSGNLAGVTALAGRLTLSWIKPDVAPIS